MFNKEMISETQHCHFRHSKERNKKVKKRKASESFTSIPEQKSSSRNFFKEKV